MQKTMYHLEAQYTRNTMVTIGWASDVICAIGISVVPISRMTIGNSRLLRNFLTIGIGRFYDCTIG